MMTSLIAAVVAIAVLTLLLVAVAMRRRPRDGRTERIDPRTLSEPWSRFVSQALHARRQFDSAVRTAHHGPIRDSLEEIGTRVGDAVRECWHVARRGDALDEGLTSLDLRQVERQRARIDEARRQPDANNDALDKTAAALDAQLASGKRLTQVATDARDRLRVLDARLDEAVARAVELSLQAADVGDLSGLGDDVDSLLVDLESLRQGLEEAGRATRLGGE